MKKESETHEPAPTQYVIKDTASALKMKKIEAKEANARYKAIVQKTVINGEYVDKPHMWNFFDCIHDPDTKTYLGEDFSFCKLWKDIGGKCYAYIGDTIVHVGEHQYEGRFVDELKPTK